MPNDNIRQITDEMRREFRARRGGRGNGDGPQTILPPPSDPMQVARVFVSECCRYADGALKIRHWRGGWWMWRGSCWIEADLGEMRKLLYAYTERVDYIKIKVSKGVEEIIYEPWSPTHRKIADLMEALAAVLHLDAHIEPPCWLDERAISAIVATANGLLDIESRVLHSHTPQYFNLVSVPFDYVPEAPQPQQWFTFLDALWADAPEAIDLLAEWFGYVISGRLDLHKIMLVVGPTRGGKGVIARVLTALVGKANVAGPTLHSLGGEYGLAPLLGKTLAVISDARFVGRDDAIVVERLLSISGEDTLTVNRKYRDQWTGKLSCRLHVVSNELPRLGDASAAIIGRIILLPLTRSWLGREDHTLEGKLLDELAGILNWALDGLHRLTIENRNRFTRVTSADEAIVQMQEMASPIGAFVRQECEVGHGEIDVDTFYGAYKVWAENNGYKAPSKQVLGRDLRAAVPGVRVSQPRDGDVRVRRYVGIKFRDTEK